MSRRISFLGLVAVTSVVLVLFYRVVSVFLLPLFLAGVVVLMLQPVYRLLLSATGKRRYLAAGVMTAGVLLAVLLPVAAVLTIAGREAAQLIDHLENGAIREKLDRARTAAGLNYPKAAECRFIQASLETLRRDAAQGATAKGDKEALTNIVIEFDGLIEVLAEDPQTPPPRSPEKLRELLQIARTSRPGTLNYLNAIDEACEEFLAFRTDLAGGPWKLPAAELANPDPNDLRRWSSQLFAMSPGWFASLSEATGSVLAKGMFGLLVFVLAVFFWFADGPEIVRTLMALSPLDDEYEEQLMKEFQTLVRGVVFGSVASALTQSALGGIGYWLAGIESVFLLMALTAVAAMIPFVGASLVWIPVCLWLLFVDGRPVAAVMFVAYGLLVISTVDNLLRPWILLETASLHPLAALIGVLGGVQALGPSGVFIGPVVVAFLQTLLMMVQREAGGAPTPSADGTRAGRPGPGGDA